MSKLIVVYPGRFQPMGVHHLKVFRELESKFGNGNVYLSTSDTTAPEVSPLSFEQKKKIALNFGIPEKKIIKTAGSPYNVDETVRNLTQVAGCNLDPESDVLVFVCGEKDLGRLQFFKKDGSPGRFQPYVENETRPFKKHVYVYIAPDIKIKFKKNNLSGTVLRNYLNTASEQQFQKVMGFYDEDIYRTLSSKSELISPPSIMPRPVLLQQESAESILAVEDLNRIEYYKQYIKNLLPEGFNVSEEGGSLTVKFPK